MAGVIGLDAAALEAIERGKRRPTEADISVIVHALGI
jgi:transcriptional regulator with XRE-family HTH domain